MKIEPIDYVAMTKAIKRLTNMMMMLTQNQLNAGVLPRAPKQFPRPPVNVFAPASTFVQPAPSGGTGGIPSAATNWMQVLWNSRAFHQGMSNGGRVPEERQGDS